MGMAASQARYLGLTARKTNVEYEGQQVNQQRTALANESAGLFRKWMSMDVPTTPSKSDYYKDVYTYNDSISSDGKVTATSIRENEGSQPPTYTVEIKYTQPGLQYACSKDQKVKNIKDGDKTKIQIISNGTTYEISETQLNEDMVKKLNSSGGPTDNEVTDKYYKFYNAANKTTYYINGDKTGFDPNDFDNEQTVNFFTEMSITETKTDKLENVTMSKSESGIFNGMYWTDKSGVQQSRGLTSGQEYDEKAYEDAMQQYNVNKQKYEKEVSDINAKTEQLQQTDRTLELRLKQLDTEQEALQTEMDSVKKVIDKNVDNVFKTFQ